MSVRLRRMKKIFLSLALVIVLLSALFILGCGETNGAGTNISVEEPISSEQLAKCEKYENEDLRDQCYLLLAMAKTNKAACDRIKDLKTRVMCYDKVELQIKYLQGLEEPTD